MLIVSAAVTVAVFAVAPDAIHERLVYGTFDAATLPPRVDYCGRRYYPESQTLSMPQVQAELARNGESGVTRVGTTAAGMPVVASVLTPASQAQLSTNACAMLVWVQTGPDRYRTYALSGGP